MWVRQVRTPRWGGETRGSLFARWQTSASLLQDAGLRDQIAELGSAAAAQGCGEFGDVGPARPYVHAEAPGYGLVDMSLDQELGDGTLDPGHAFGGGVVRDLVEQRCAAPPQLLEDLDEVLDESGMPEFQGHPAVVARGDEGDRAVEDDQALDELFEGADFGLAAGYPVDVGERPLAVPDGVLVQRPYADAAVDQGPVPLQRLNEDVLAASAPGWTVSISVPHSAVARLRAALILSKPSSTVIAWVLAGVWALRAMNGSKESVSSTDSRLRSWISRSIGCSRWASAMEGRTGRSQFTSSGSGCNSASSTRHGADSTSMRVTRPVVNALA